MEALLENLFVLIVGLISGGYIFRRLNRMGKAHKRRQAACSDCSSATCAPVVPIEKGETPLPLR